MIFLRILNLYVQTKKIPFGWTDDISHIKITKPMAFVGATMRTSKALGQVGRCCLLTSKTCLHLHQG